MNHLHFTAIIPKNVAYITHIRVRVFPQHTITHKVSPFNYYKKETSSLFVNI